MHPAVGLANLFTTLPLVGLIWAVQAVVYPQFFAVGAAEWAAYHAAHTAKITLVVGPLMLAEAAAALAWVAVAPRDPAAWAGLALVAVCWGVTFFWAVPLHNQLAHAQDVSRLQSLLLANLTRAIAWTLRAGLLAWAWRVSAPAP